MARKLSAWDEYKHPLRGFTPHAAQEIFSERRSRAIVGPPGVGKSTFLLCLVEAALGRKSWPRRLFSSGQQPWFKDVLFLNPKEYRAWLDELVNLDPEETLVAIDAPYRRGDTDAIKADKSDYLSRIGSGFEVDGVEKDAFRVIVTLRQEEYTQVAQKFPRNSFAEHRVKWSRDDLWRILCSHLERLRVKNQIGESPSRELLGTLEEKSQGLALYCRELAVHLKATEKGMTAEALKEFPAGLVNLVVDALEKLCPEPMRDGALSLLCLMAEADQPFSEHFFDHVARLSVEACNDTNLQSKWDLLRTHYTGRVEDRPVRALNSHWAATLAGLAKGELSADATYFHVAEAINRRWRDLSDYRRKTAESIFKKVNGGLRDSPRDFLLCVDLAKLGEEYAQKAFELWQKADGAKRDLRGAITKEFYEALVNYGFETATLRSEDSAPAIAAFDRAFTVQKDAKDLMWYIKYLRRYGLRRTVAPEESEKWKKKIIEVFGWLFELDKGDKQSLNYRAGFWAEVGEYDEAEKDFQTALRIKTGDLFKDLATVHQYAIFLRERALELWKTNPDEGEKKLDDAKRLFEGGVKQLEQRGDDPKVQKVKAMFLNAHAGTLIREARKQLERDMAAELDAQAVDLLKNAHTTDPANPVSVNMRADVLIKYSWMLPGYKGKQAQPLRDAKSVLEDGLTQQGDSRNPGTLRILGRLLYHPRLPERNFDSAKKYLEDSAERGGSFQRYIAYHELGKLFIAWGRTERENAETRWQSAEQFLLKALPETHLYVYERHRAGVYASLARLCYLRHRAEEAKDWFAKLVAIAGSAATPLLSEIGDQLLADGDVNTAALCFAQALSREGRSWYPAAALARCKQLQEDVDGCLTYFRVAMERARDAPEYASIRNGLNDAKQRFQEKNLIGKEQLAAYQGAMLKSSEKAYELMPGYWKNCADLSEDLLTNAESRAESSQQFANAVDRAKQAVNLYLKDTKRARRSERGRLWIGVSRRESLNRFCWTLGKAYARLSKLESARIYLRRGASIENEERGWYELARVANKCLESKDFIKAFEIYLDFVGALPVDKKQKAFVYRLPNLMWSAPGHYKSVGNTGRAALAEKYDSIIGFAIFPPFDPPEGTPGRSNDLISIARELEMSKCSGNMREKFLSAGTFIGRHLREPMLSLECFLNAVRMSQLGAFLRPQTLRELGEAASAVACRALARWALEEALKRELYEEWKNRISRQIGELGEPKQLSKVEQAILRELGENASSALAFYRTLLDAGEGGLDQATIGSLPKIGALRIALDALIIHRDWEAARAACGKLQSLAGFPERLYLECLASHLGSTGPSRGE